ncbi:DUF4135 domain-containing protein [Nocardiopsis changdeensis]|nr:DUF4135 domain-containing protein [Nocardiopsis sp. MT53]QYX39087.1 DUF4135 domain-containing protein [Nocardiopsis sp. MT53]
MERQWTVEELPWRRAADDAAGDAPASGAPEAWVRRADARIALGRDTGRAREAFLADADAAGFLRPALDAVHGHQRALHDAATALVRGADPRLAGLPDLLAGAWPDEELSRLMTPTVALEMQFAQLSGRIGGASGEARFRAYLELLSRPRVQRELWEEYTVLLRRVAEVLSRWEESRLELARDLVADLPELDRLHGGRLDAVTLVDFGSGYVRRPGGLAGAVVSFGDVRMVRTPRPPDAAVLWEGIVSWFNARGPAHRLASVPVLRLPDHGWTLRVEHEPCPEGEGVAFYWRLGAVTALAHALSGSAPRHRDIVAHGAHPVLTDAERLLAGVVRPPERPVDAAVSQDGDEDDPLDEEPLEDDEHLPGSGGGVLPLEGHTGALTDGFAFAYDALVADRGTWLSRKGPLGGLSRALLRHDLYPAALYTASLDAGDRPDLLRDGLTRSLLLPRPLPGDGDARLWSALLRAESTDLLRGDLPHLSGPAGAVDLVDSAGRTVPGVLAEAPAASVRRRLRSLDRHGAGGAVALVRRTARDLCPDDPDAADPRPGDHPLDGETALAAAADLARGLSPRDPGAGPLLARLADLDGGPGLRARAEAAADHTAALRFSPRAPDRFGRAAAALVHLAAAGAVRGHDARTRGALAHLDLLRGHTGTGSPGLAGGRAGTVLAALALHAALPGAGALAVADRVASVLAEETAAAPPEPGMASGSTGVLVALSRMDAALPGAGYGGAVGRLLSREREALERRPPADVSWCHGLAGIGLSRLSLLADAREPAVRSAALEDLASLERAVRDALLRGGLRSTGDHGACHGDLGVLEFLVSAARWRGGGAEEAPLRAAAGLCAHGRARGWCLTPGAAPALSGAAGAGYSLLRLAFPHAVPSLLLVSPP